MKKTFLALCLFSIAFVACHKADTTPYEITFDVKNATGGTSLDAQVGKETTFDITFTHKTKGTVHKVKVSVLDAAVKEIKVLEDKHAHATATYNAKLKYTPSTAGSYTLKVFSANDKDEEPNTVSLPFLVK
jgi:hypothetical protein